MWSIISWALFLLSLVIIREFPLDKRLRAQARAAWNLVVVIVLTAFALAPPVRLGTVQAGSGMTHAGVYQGSLLISTPGGALQPGSQAGLRRLIISPDRVSADSHAKGRPAQVAFSLAIKDYCPLQVSACAAGRSSVRVVTRTAGVKLSKFRAFRLRLYCKGNGQICM